LRPEGGKSGYFFERRVLIPFVYPSILRFMHESIPLADNLDKPDEGSEGEKIYDEANKDVFHDRAWGMVTG
jgi:hypothetical protein